MYYAEYAKFTYHSSTFLNKHFLISKVHFFLLSEKSSTFKGTKKKTS